MGCRVRDAAEEVALMSPEQRYTRHCDMFCHRRISASANDPFHVAAPPCLASDHPDHHEGVISITEPRPLPIASVMCACLLRSEVGSARSATHSKRCAVCYAECCVLRAIRHMSDELRAACRVEQQSCNASRSSRNRSDLALLSLHVWTRVSHPFRMPWPDTDSS